MQNDAAFLTHVEVRYVNGPLAALAEPENLMQSLPSYTIRKRKVYITFVLRFYFHVTISIRFVLLGRVALGAQRPIVIKLSRVRSVGRSVCLVHCG